jgi:hypothetical protein
VIINCNQGNGCWEYVRCHSSLFVWWFLDFLRNRPYTRRLQYFRRLSRPPTFQFRFRLLLNGRSLLLCIKAQSLNRTGMVHLYLHTVDLYLQIHCRLFLALWHALDYIPPARYRLPLDPRWIFTSARRLPEGRRNVRFAFGILSMVECARRSCGRFKQLLCYSSLALPME